jgi:hypothetical protein
MRYYGYGRHARPKAPSPRHLDMTVSQVYDNRDLINMLDSRHLNLIFIQVQGNVGLANMPDSRHLDLTVS